MNPDVGRQAAEENRDEIHEVLKGADLVFVTYGLGGGVGTGAGPIVAEAARDVGALTVGVVTRPFAFEGQQRSRIAGEGLDRLQEKVDTLITIPNDKLLQTIDRNTSLIEGFKVVDDVLRQAVQGISDIIVTPGLVNVDFADLKAIMSGAGSALMGIGRASGDDRAVNAAKMAINSPLLEVSINGAKKLKLRLSLLVLASMFLNTKRKKKKRKLELIKLLSRKYRRQKNQQLFPAKLVRLIIRLTKNGTSPPSSAKR